MKEGRKQASKKQGRNGSVIFCSTGLESKAVIRTFGETATDG